MSMMEAGGYDEDNVPTGGMSEGPPEETAEGDNGKQSQEEAEYRKGSPVKCCGLCVNFEGAANGTCRVVAGSISPYGVSSSFKIAQNPFGSVLGPRERAAVEEMTQSGPDQSRFAGMANMGGMGGSMMGVETPGPTPQAGPQVPSAPSPTMEAQNAPGTPQSARRFRIGRQAY